MNNYQKIVFKNTGIENIRDKFDIIWVTSILESHIQGRNNRVDFYKHLKRCLRPRGLVVMTPFIRPLHWRTPYFWSSQFLRLRWLGNNQWEKGDVLLSNLGAHHKNDHLVYSHFYQGKENFITELKLGDFHSPMELPQESWIVR